MVTDTANENGPWAFEGDDFASCHATLNSFFDWRAVPVHPDRAFPWKLNLIRLRTPEGMHGRMIIARIRTEAPFQQTPIVDNAEFVILLPIKGQVKATSAQDTIPKSAGETLIYQPLAVQRLDLIPDNGVYEAAFVKLSFDYAQKFLSETLHHPVERNLNILPASNPADSKNQLLINLISVLCSPNFSDTAPAFSVTLQKRIIETFTQLLLELVPHRYTERLQSQSAMPLPHHIRLAQKYLESHVMDQPPIAEVARVAKVSVRTLEVNFRTYLDMTPRTYLRVVRLRLARQALVSSSETRPIADIAKSLGFAHMSRFSKYYASLFGETPSDTRRNADA